MKEPREINGLHGVQCCPYEEGMTENGRKCDRHECCHLIHVWMCSDTTMTRSYKSQCNAEEPSKTFMWEKQAILRLSVEILAIFAGCLVLGYSTTLHVRSLSANALFESYDLFLQKLLQNVRKSRCKTETVHRIVSCRTVNFFLTQNWNRN